MRAATKRGVGTDKNAVARPARRADARGRSPGASLGAPSARADASATLSGWNAAGRRVDRRSPRCVGTVASRGRFRALPRGRPRFHRTLGVLIPPKCMAVRAVSFRRGSERGHDRRVVRFARLGSHKRTWSVPTSSTRRARRCDARAEVPGTRGTARRRLGQISSATFSIARSRSFQSRRFSCSVDSSREWVAGARLYELLVSTRVVLRPDMTSATRARFGV